MLEILTSMGVNFGQYALCDTICSFFQTSYSLKQKTKNCLGKFFRDFFQKHDLRFVEIWHMCPQNYFQKKVLKFFLSVHNLQGIWGTKLVFFLGFLRPQFSLNIFSLFSTLKSRMPKNMFKLRHNVRNGQNLPHGSLNFRNNFFLRNFTDTIC